MLCVSEGLIIKTGLHFLKEISESQRITFFISTFRERGIRGTDHKQSYEEERDAGTWHIFI